MGNELPTSDELATKIFWITIVGAVLFGGAVYFFVL